MKILYIILTSFLLSNVKIEAMSFLSWSHKPKKHSFDAKKSYLDSIPLREQEYAKALQSLEEKGLRKKFQRNKQDVPMKHSFVYPVEPTAPSLDHDVYYIDTNSVAHKSPAKQSYIKAFSAIVCGSVLGIFGAFGINNLLNNCVK